MAWDVVFTLVVPLHQIEHFLQHVRLGRKVELSGGIRLDRSERGFTLVSNQVRQNRFLVWLVSEQVGWLIIGSNFDGRMASKIGITQKDHRLATYFLNTLDELLLKAS